jgi:hypothetical protein
MLSGRLCITGHHPNIIACRNSGKWSIGPLPADGIVSAFTGTTQSIWFAYAGFDDPRHSSEGGIVHGALAH